MTKNFTMFCPRLLRKVVAVVALVFLSVGWGYAQTHQITGTVKDSMGPVIGATVMVEGTTVGASTNVDGTFSLAVPAGAKTLKVSYIGYDDVVLPITAARSVYDVELKESSTALDDVVVVGYAEVKRRDVVGSVSSVNSEKLTQMPVASVTEAMSGRMAGVQVTASEGDPDAEIKVRVRGNGSITQDSSPLYIVDGFPVESISDIPASDIQSIDVLKDAFSTAIYGSRGANGVVIVTTKGGSQGKVTVNYNAYVGFKSMANKGAITPSDPYNFVRLQYENALINNKIANYESTFGEWSDMDLYRNAAGNDWVDQLFGRTGTQFNHNFTVSGGSEHFKWTAGYSHLEDKAIMIGSNFKRNNLNFKGQAKTSKRTSIDLNFRYSKTEVRGAGANSLNDKGSNQSGRLKHSIIYMPLPASSIIAGIDEEEDFGDATLPTRAVTDNDERRDRTNWTANAAFNWEIIDNLKLKVEAGLDEYRQTGDRFYGISTYYSQQSAVKDFQGMPATQYTDQSRRRIRSTNTLNYDFKNLLSKDHKLNVLLGQEYIVTRSSKVEAWAEGLPLFFTSEMAWNFMSSASNPRSINNLYANDDVLFSFFGRVNYDYKGKYMISATMRADGSSKFMKGHQWGYFPSAAVAWRISDEFGLNEVQWLDNLKLRYSFGTAGNNNIPSGQTVQEFSSANSAWISQGSVVWKPGNAMANPDLKWETTYSHNIGLDFGFFNNRLSGSVEVYQNDTKDLLINFPVTGSGYNTQYRNMGQVRNKGIEVTLSAAPVRKEKWGINIDANIAFNKNEVVDLGAMKEILQTAGMFSTEVENDYIVKTGRPLGDIYGYVTAGRYEVSDFTYDAAKDAWTLRNGVVDCSDALGVGSKLRPGYLKLADLDGDGKPDKTLLGNVQPKFAGGFALSAYAYGVDFAANFTYSYGNKVYNANKIEFTTMYRQNRNMLAMMNPDNAWTNVDWQTGELYTDPAALEAANAATTMWSPHITRRINHSWAIEDASFLRLASLTIGYTIPETLTKKIRLNRVRIYATGTNLFCWTPYTGYDPEVDTRRQTPLTPNVDYSAYPKSRSWVFGINLTF